MRFPYGQTVTVTRPAERDSHGDPTGPPIPHQLPGCAIGWGETSTDHDRRETAITGLTLYCPPESDIRAGDRVTLPGDTTTYLVDGRPLDWGPSPWTGWEPGIVVRLKGVE